MNVPNQNLMQCFEIFYHDERTKFERPGKMRRASLRDNFDFFK